MNRWLFILFYFIYSVFSLICFTLTSGGWTGFLLIGFGGVVLLVMTNVLVIGSTIYYAFKKKNKLSLPIKFLYLVIVAQIVALLFNVGDCGDASGSYSFFERLLRINGWEICHQPLLGVWAHYLWQITTGVYVLALVGFLLRTVFGIKNYLVLAALSLLMLFPSHFVLMSILHHG